MAARGYRQDPEQPFRFFREVPRAGRDRVTFQVAAIVPWLIMKGMALADRLKEKDAYDIFYAVRCYPGGTEALATAFRPHIGNRLVREGLEKIRAQFLSVDHAGPKWVADFFERWLRPGLMR